MTRLLKLIASALIVAAACIGCGKPNLTGTYANEADAKETIQFFKNGKWASDWAGSRGGIGGDYTVEGKTLLVQGPFGFSETGEIQGDNIVISKHSFSAREQRKTTFKKQ